jgi:hypothetical protein
MDETLKNKLAWPIRLAVVIGVLLPMAETVRRCGTGGYVWNWLDDYLIGAFLLYAAWRCRRNIVSGQRVLAAAWAFACGLGYSSFFGHVERWGEPDVGNLAHEVVTITISAGWLLAIWAMVATLRSKLAAETEMA